MKVTELKRWVSVAMSATPVTRPFVPRLRAWRQHSRYRRLYEKYRDATMVPNSSFLDNLSLCRRFGTNEGLVVECGVWRGGMIAAMAEVLGPRQTYYLFDSFEGLPPAKADLDGEAAVAYQADGTHPRYLDNCRATMEEAEAVMLRAGVPGYRIVKGWYKDTLPRFVPSAPITVLRLDSDWYESTMECLTALYQYVSPRGLILMDDYYAWDGCARAVHDFLSRESVADRLRQTIGGVAYIVKGSVGDDLPAGTRYESAQPRARVRRGRGSPAGA